MLRNIGLVVVLVVLANIPAAAQTRIITGKVTDGDPNCGNGIAWSIDHRGLTGRRVIASGDIPNGGAQGFATARDRPCAVVRG